ncbi:hypothetical protein [Frankia sp. QA3]|uniref:hypothetical protein n=1 Tax=Frankia sp. QA3 TaxID=710111 RepID=UPI000269B6DD|nr:hypothetical protein [Frankia sp. QA3]EIV90903.1 hypothetical protein FraQA3DRAFT_0315 [Frankia sp. QA3]
MKLLLDLLDLLPTPDLDDQGEFWEAFSRAQEGGLQADYIVGKLAVWAARAHEEPANSYYAHELADYCLMFFDGESQAMWELLGDRVAAGGRSGRRFAESVCETAWLIYVPLQAAMRREATSTARSAQGCGSFEGN